MDKLLAMGISTILHLELASTLSSLTAESYTQPVWPQRCENGMSVKVEERVGTSNEKKQLDRLQFRAGLPLFLNLLSPSHSFSVLSRLVSLSEKSQI
jgi:hypothetical protein